MHEAQRRLIEQRREATTEATKAGALQSTRLILTVAEAAEKVHIEIMQQAATMLCDFAQRMGVAPKQLTEVARLPLENLGNSLLGVIPPCGFPNDHQRIVARYRAQFELRLDGMLRDVEIGFVKGAGFEGVTTEDEWVSAAEAIAMLHPTFTNYAARMRICERAHAGMIRARAQQLQFGNRVSQNDDVPKSFWWAKGHAALEQDWQAGDFSTWKDKNIEWKAFGVTFARADIQKLVPPQSSAKKEVTTTTTAEDEQIIAQLDDIVPSAAVSYKQAVIDLSDEGRLSFRGPALELREALRETLDHLAPDDKVMAMPGYKQEPQRAGPTMKQKVRFILGKNSGDAPENAVTALEEAISTLTRSVYDRSSKATHVAGERRTVLQVRRYVVVVLHDILGM